MPDALSTTSIELPGSVSSEIWQKSIESSVFMRLSRRTELPGNGTTIPVVVGDPLAGWVREGEEAPVGKHTLATKDMAAYKLELIEPFTNEFRDDYGRLYDELVNRLPGAISKSFDQTIAGFIDAPGENFDTLADAPIVDVSTKTYDSFVDATDKVDDADGDLDHWLLNAKARTLLLKTKDTTNRPLFLSNPATQGAPSSVLSIPAEFSKHMKNPALPNFIGFGGDFSGARFGVVDAIRISLADQATLSVVEDGKQKLLNLFQRGMFAVKIEFRAGWICRNVDEFVALYNGLPEEEEEPQTPATPPAGGGE